MSDLNSSFILIIFISLIIVLTSFFIITEDGLNLKEDASFNDSQLPYNVTLIGSNANQTMSEKGPGGTGSIIGELMILGGIIIGIASLGSLWWISAPLIGGGVLQVISVLPNGDQIIRGVPIIGDIWNGLNYVGQMMQSLWGLVFYGIPELGGFPIIGYLIAVPIGFFFFMLILRFIRGQ